MKQIAYIVFLFCYTAAAAYGQSSYSHAQEMELKGHIKTIKEYSFEGYRADDGSYRKRGEHYFRTAVTEFNKDGNIINRTEYNFNTAYGNTQLKDTLASINKTVYHYAGSTCTGYTEYTNDVKTTEATRVVHNDHNYTDSVYGFIQPGGVERLVRWERKFLNTNYREDSSYKFIFYEVAVYVAKESKKVSVELITPKKPQPEKMVRIPDEQYNKKDKAGNYLADVWGLAGPIKAGEDVEISEYSYEYY